MEDDIKKKIIEAFQRDIEKPDPRGDKVVEYEEYGWEYDTLEEALLDYMPSADLYESELKGDQNMQYQIGDIVMTRFYSPASRKVVSDAHRILVITSKKDEEGITRYRGFELSSKTEKSNKNSKYANNIYINNYSSILDKGAKADKEAIIRVDDLVKFNSKDHDISGTWKGHVSDEFLEFVQKAYSNYKSGRSNAELYWEK